MSSETCPHCGARHRTSGASLMGAAGRLVRCPDPWHEALSTLYGAPMSDTSRAELERLREAVAVVDRYWQQHRARAHRPMPAEMRAALDALGRARATASCLRPETRERVLPENEHALPPLSPSTSHD